MARISLDPRLKDLAQLAAAGKICCSWWMDFGYWGAAAQHQVPAQQARAIPGSRLNAALRVTARGFNDRCEIPAAATA